MGLAATGGGQAWAQETHRSACLDANIITGVNQALIPLCSDMHEVNSAHGTFSSVRLDKGLHPENRRENTLKLS